jgi:excisionase family DNA binding protein
VGEALFVTVREAAELLGVSDDLVYDLVASGELPSARFGRRVMVPRRALELIVERALDGFDPDAAVRRFATP